MTHRQFELHYNENVKALMNFAMKLSRDCVDAEDLVQETAIKSYKGRHTFKEGTSFKSWAFTILKNTFITRYNKKKKSGVVNKPIEDFTFALESKHSLKNDALSKMRIREIESCIDQLSYKSRLPFLKYVEGFQYNEIAETLNIPIGTVKSRINYARTKLKDVLEQRGIAA